MSLRFSSSYSQYRPARRSQGKQLDFQLEVSVQAVGDAMKTALENGTALTIDGMTSAISAVANASGFASLASSFASIVQTTNQKLLKGITALALSDPSNEDSITLLSNARATAVHLRILCYLQSRHPFLQVV